MTARARAKEGDEFTEKDAFVTPAYLAQQEELRKAEEAEKLKEGTFSYPLSCPDSDSYCQISTRCQEWWHGIVLC